MQATKKRNFSTETIQMKRTRMIYDILFYMYQKNNFKLTEVKEAFNHLPHFEDSIIESYIKDVIDIVNPQYNSYGRSEVTTDILVGELVEQYSSRKMITDTDWLRNFHFNHKTYSKTYAEIFVQ